MKAHQRKTAVFLELFMTPIKEPGSQSRLQGLPRPIDENFYGSEVSNWLLKQSGAPSFLPDIFGSFQMKGRQSADQGAGPLY